MKKVLLVSYGGGHANMLIPLYQKLLKNNQINTEYLALTGAQLQLKSLSLPFLTYRDFISTNDQKYVNKYGKLLLEDIPNKKFIPEAETISYLGMNYYELLQTNSEDSVKEIYQKIGRQAFLPVNFFKSILHKNKPDLVICTNSPRSEKACLLAAKELDIDSICITDLFNKTEFADRLATTGYGNKICVLSEKVKQLLTSYGRPANEVEVTGNPSLDNLSVPPNKKTMDKFKSQKGLNSDSKLILYARTHLKVEQELSEKIENFLIDFVKTNSDYHVAFRLHPNEVKKFENLPKNIWISSRENDDLKTLLYRSNSVVAICSTVLLEAYMTASNPIQYVTNREENRLNFADLNFAKAVKNLDELECALKYNLNSTAKPIINQPSNATQNIYQLALNRLGI